MREDNRREVNLYADARRADEEYREAERSHRGGESKIPAPMLLTLMCLTDDDAHEIVESIKEHGGVLVSAAGMHTKTVHCSIADLRRWGETKKVYRSSDDPRYRDVTDRM